MKRTNWKLIVLALAPFFIGAAVAGVILSPPPDRKCKACDADCCPKTRNCSCLHTDACTCITMPH